MALLQKEQPALPSVASFRGVASEIELSSGAFEPRGGGDSVEGDGTSGAVAEGRGSDSASRSDRLIDESVRTPLPLLRVAATEVDGGVAARDVVTGALVCATAAALTP